MSCLTLLFHSVGKILQEWPLVRDVTLSHLAPTLRPPDLPLQKPPRPNLLYRIARRLKNYWSPPVEGVLRLKWQYEKLTIIMNSKIFWVALLCVCVCVHRASKSGRARAVEGAAAFYVRAVYSDAQQKPSREGQSKNTLSFLVLFKSCTLKSTARDLTFSVYFVYFWTSSAQMTPWWSVQSRVISVWATSSLSGS